MTQLESSGPRLGEENRTRRRPLLAHRAAHEEKLHRASKATLLGECAGQFQQSWAGHLLGQPEPGGICSGLFQAAGRQRL
jgi:hypothetical protein